MHECVACIDMYVYVHTYGRGYEHTFMCVQDIVLLECRAEAAGRATSGAEVRALETTVFVHANIHTNVHAHIPCRTA